VLAAARRARPGLVTWAAARGVPDAVELLVSVGFDVNGYGRSDAPIDQPWHTALHIAAGDGNLRLAERLLALGADRELRDRRFDATPLGWAQHFHHRALIDLLAAT
jgi:ankyrin repeat protein